MEPATQKPTDNPEYWNNALHVVLHASIWMQTITIAIRAYMSFPLLLVQGIWQDATIQNHLIC